MRLSRRQLLRQIGAGAAGAAAMPSLAAASTGLVARGPSLLRLSANENAYGPSPAAIAAVRALDDSALSRYPDVEIAALRRAIARLHGVTDDRIVVGCGSADVIGAAVDAFLAPGRLLVTARPTCDIVRRCADRLGAKSVAVPLAHDWSHDLPRMLDAARTAAGLVYICNPNNPTGTLTPRARLDAFMTALPAGARVIVDEAYHHYVGRSADYASFIDEPIADPRVIVVRSLSKAYGLAGMRVGYAIASADVARAMTKRLGGGNEATMTAAAAIAAAAALEDTNHIRASVARTVDDRQEFFNQANARMLRVIDSCTNFVMLNAQRPASPIVDHFARNGISLPPPFTPLDEYVRVSLGTPSDMAEFWRIWDLMAMSHAG